MVSVHRAYGDGPVVTMVPEIHMAVKRTLLLKVPILGKETVVLKVAMMPKVLYCLKCL